MERQQLQQLHEQTLCRRLGKFEKGLTHLRPSEALKGLLWLFPVTFLAPVLAESCLILIWMLFPHSAGRRLDGAISKCVKRLSLFVCMCVVDFERKKGKNKINFLPSIRLGGTTNGYTLQGLFVHSFRVRWLIYCILSNGCNAINLVHASMTTSTRK